MRLLNAAPPDSVAELLAGLTVRSSVYCLSDLGAPWGFQVDGASVAKFHLVLDGCCWLRVEGLDPVRLGPGELVILPRGEQHTVGDTASLAAPPLDQVIAEHPLDEGARLRYGGDGRRTRLLCGGFALSAPMPGPLLTLLPPILTIDRASASIPAWIEPVFALVRDEARSATPGAQAIFAKLADVLLSQALRTYLTGPAQAGLLESPPQPDRLIEEAAELMRNQPTRLWTLQALARETGLSRTLFATRFRAAIGESPMRYLARVRLGQAAGHLSTGELSIEAIARRTGYANDASLSKAFKREFGVSPGAYREARLDGASLVGTVGPV